MNAGNLLLVQPRNRLVDQCTQGMVQVKVLTSNDPWRLHGIWLGAIGDPDSQHIPIAIRVDHKLLVEALGTVVLDF